MTENIARQPAGIPVGGQFAPSVHSEPGITLTKPRGYDPDDVAKGILNDLRDIPEGWTRELFYDTVNAVRAGETTYEEFLDGLITKNRGGRCERHENDPGHSPEQFCHDCHVSFMVEARTNPKPLPVPRGVIPVRQENHRLAGQEISSSYDEEFRISNTTTKMTGDEQFEAAVRRMFKAPADATVEVIEEETESGTDWTRETSTEITVKCDGRQAVYEYMGSFMRALDQAEQNPQAMALRFMRGTSGERPLLNGIAAVYLHKGEFSDPKPVFGKIRNVFAGGSDPSMDFLHVDGRQEYLSFNRVAAILETDQSSEYIEKPRPLPTSSIGYGDVVSETVDDDGGVRLVQAMTTTPDFDGQLRSRLGIEDAAAPVTMSLETVYFEGEEGQLYTAACAGKEVSHSDLHRMLTDISEKETTVD